jgi:hypothetical protein
MASACRVEADPDAGHFSCEDATDCGKGFECIAQLLRPRGLCYLEGQCVTETCNQLDDDCNGVADDPFDLQADNAHCGACGVACGAGTTCREGKCVEADCGDGQDGDGDGKADCLDADCDGRTCKPGVVCAASKCP